MPIRSMRHVIVAAALLMAASAAAQSKISFLEAQPVITALGASLPAELRGRTAREMAPLWPSWVDRHDRDVRARLARGDEDSLVNFWLYGTSFTSHPAALARDVSTSAAAVDDLAVVGSTTCSTA